MSTYLNDPRVMQFVELIARMETNDEIDERTDDGMSGDDAVETLSALIHEARELLK